MKTGHFFPFFCSDFTKTVRERKMKPEEVGALVMLMCQQWETGEPVDAASLDGFTNWDMRMVNRLIDKLFAAGRITKDENGRYASERMTTEIEKYRAKVARVSHTRKGDVAETTDGHLGDICENNNDYNASTKITAVELEKDSEEEKRIIPPNPRKRGKAVTPVVSPEQFEANAKLSRDLLGELKKPRARRRRGPLTPEEQALAMELRAIYDKAAKNETVCLEPAAWSESRDVRHVRRVLAIGGVENYRKALWAIKDDEFFSGRKTGFRMGWEVLMQDGLRPNSAFGDVLMRLIDIANRPKSANIQPVNGKTWGWWRKVDVSTFDIAMWRGAIKSNDFQSAKEWPWWIAGPPLGHTESFIPAQIVTEFKLDQKFGASGNA